MRHFAPAIVNADARLKGVSRWAQVGTPAMHTPQATG
jgi:hypothetical protein